MYINLPFKNDGLGINLLFWFPAFRFFNAFIIIEELLTLLFKEFFASGSNTFKRFSLISVVWCCNHSCHACLETFSKILGLWHQETEQSPILPFPFGIYGKILVDSFCILKRITVLDVYGHVQSQLQPVLVKFRQYDHVHLPKLLVSKLYQIHLL